MATTISNTRVIELILQSLVPLVVAVPFYFYFADKNMYLIIISYIPCLKMLYSLEQIKTADRQSIIRGAVFIISLGLLFTLLLFISLPSWLVSFYFNCFLLVFSYFALFLRIEEMQREKLADDKDLARKEFLDNECMECTFYNIIDCLRRLDPTRSDEQLKTDFIAIEGILPERMKNIDPETWSRYFDSKISELSSKGKSRSSGVKEQITHGKEVVAKTNNWFTKLFSNKKDGDDERKKDQKPTKEKSSHEDEPEEAVNEEEEAPLDTFGNLTSKVKPKHKQDHQIFIDQCRTGLSVARKIGLDGVADTVSSLIDGDIDTNNNTSPLESKNDEILAFLRYDLYMYFERAKAWGKLERAILVAFWRYHCIDPIKPWVTVTLLQNTMEFKKALQAIPESNIESAVDRLVKAGCLIKKGKEYKLAD